MTEVQCIISTEIAFVIQFICQYFGWTVLITNYGDIFFYMQLVLFDPMHLS